MNLSRIGPAFESAGKHLAIAEVARWALGGGVGVAALLMVAVTAPHDAGWRSIGLRAGVFAALAALLPDPRRRGAASVVDLSVAIWACLLELVAGSAVTQACVGVAASAAGWSLGRGALALSSLSMAAAGPLAMEAEAAAVTWFTALQRTPPERFDWNGLERWMREHPSHRDAYERVEAVWYATSPEDVVTHDSPLQAALNGLSRVTAVTRLGLWLAPSFANRIVLFSAAVALTAVAVYA